MSADVQAGALPLDGAALTIQQAAGLHLQLREAVARGGDLHLDCSGVAEVDSAGMHLLIATAHSAADQGTALHLDQPSAALRDFARRYGLSDWLDRHSGS